MPDYTRLRPAPGIEMQVPEEEAYEMAIRLQERRPREPVYEYYPTETAGRPDLRSITIYGQPMEPEPDIEDLPQQDYELGRLTIKRQFTDDMKIANGYRDIDPQTYEGLAAEAGMTMQSRLAKLQMNLDRTEMAFKQIRQNPNFSPGEQFEGKTKFYDANPVWKTPRIRRPATPEMVEERRGAPLAVSSITDMAKRAVDVIREAETWYGRNPSREEVISRLKESADIGGWRDRNPATKDALLAALDAELKVTEEVEDTWDEEMKNEIAEYIGMPPTEPIIRPIIGREGEILRGEQVPEEYRRLGVTEYRPPTRETERREITAPETLPAKPLGYPDAVWSEQYKMWTIFKNGRLIGLQEE